ncbi:MAG: helix-turn-helix transcriptional regulator [Firmicutes bacterium]|nr:helix-turn-helix transcriptional regulator [Bacillota bacterium]
MYKKFAELLEKNQKTSYQVSKDTGIAENIFSYWKNGRSKPKVDKLKILADYFGVSIEYFLEDDMSQHRESKERPTIKSQVDHCKNQKKFS